MLGIVGWELWYGDGTVFTNKDGTWAQAPYENVQALIMLHKRPYATVILGEDTYSLRGRKTTKNGKWMPDEEWDAMFEKVNNRVREWASKRA